MSWDVGEYTEFISEEATHEFSYLYPGSYTITLTLGYPGGEVSETETITVSTGEELVVDFTWSPGSPSAGETITVSDASTGAAAVTWWYYEWYVGNDLFSASNTDGSDVEIVFPTAGTYTVQMILYGAVGFMGANSNDITVSA